MNKKYKLDGQKVGGVIPMCCEKCGKMGGLLLLIVGLAFLCQDRGWWNFWNLNGWTVAFILAGLAMMCMSCCPMCRAVCKTEEPKTKRK
jgi:hypothetical protein